MLDKLAYQAVVGLLSTLAYFGVSSRPSRAEDWGDRLLTEAPTQWDAYARSANKLQGSIRWENYHDGRIVLSTELNFKNRPDCRLIEIQSDMNAMSSGSAPGGEVRAYNDEYGFVLARKQRDQQWIATSMLRRTSDDMPIIGLTDQTNVHLRPLIQLVGKHDLKDLVSQPNFKILATDVTQVDERLLVVVNFQNVGSSHVESPCPIQRGSLSLDPQALWVLRSATLECLYPGGTRTWVTIDHEFITEMEDLPIPKRRIAETIHDSPRKGKFTAKEFKEYGLAIPTKQPARGEFLMSAFGLPEPFENLEKRTPLYVWVMLGGAACVVGAAMYAWWRRRI